MLSLIIPIFLMPRQLLDPLTVGARLKPRPVGLKTHSYEKNQMKEDGFVTYYAEHYKLLHSQILRSLCFLRMTGSEGFRMTSGFIKCSPFWQIAPYVF
jgi:hypothetical protein